MAIIGMSGKAGVGKDLVGQIIINLTSGKEYVPEVGWIQKRQYSNDWEIKKFADKLKDIVCIILGCTREQLEDRDFKEKELGEEWRVFYALYSDEYFTEEHIFSSKQDRIDWINSLSDSFDCRKIWSETLTIRDLLQKIGTNLFRNQLHPNIWVNATMADYKLLHKFTGEQPKVETIHSEYYYPNWIITDCRFPNEADAIKKRNGIIIRVNTAYIRYPDGSYRAKSKMMGDFDNQHESEIALDNYKFDYVIDNNGTIEELIEKVKEMLEDFKII